MRTVAMCFSSILQIPRCRIHTYADLWKEKFQSISRTYDNSYSFNLFGPKIYGLEGGHGKRWTRRPVTTKTQGLNKMARTSKPSNIRNEILDVSVSTSSPINIYKTEKSFETIEYCNIEQHIQNKDLASPVTVMVFDIETTGFSRKNERIIEIAVQDLNGGENSTFQTLVHPECSVPNTHIHGITTHMVTRHGVPRMKELIPLLLQFIQSRQKSGGSVLLVAHNARSFDVPFLLEEFSRCSFEVPSNWCFLDTLSLARELMKSSGSKLPARISLQALREFYGIPLDGTAHRAMSDVEVLSRVLRRLTFELKLPVSALVERWSFTASDLNKKKKN